jgi:AcrR family transcriptional regulator
MEIGMPRTQEACQLIRDERKEQILRTAAEVFERNGLANTKISDLAEAAGISQGLLYRYFANKEEVFAELMEWATHRAIRQAQDALDRSGTPWEKLSWLTEQFLQDIVQNRMYYQLLAQSLALSGRVREIIERLEALAKALRQLIIEGQASGQVAKRDPDQLVLLYLCCLYGLAASISLRYDKLEAHIPDAEAVLHFLKA